jgi:hypothetical protein
MPTINNITINETMIDGDTGISVISIDTYEKIQLPLERLIGPPHPWDKFSSP